MISLLLLHNATFAFDHHREYRVRVAISITCQERKNVPLNNAEDLPDEFSASHTLVFVAVWSLTLQI